MTADDVNRVAKTYFQKHNRTVGLYIPVEGTAAAGDRRPSPSIEALVKDYKGGTVGGGRRGVRPDAGEPRRPDSRSSTMGGIKAGLLPKKNRGETVSLVLTLHYGNEESLKGQTTAAGMLPGMMMAGTKKHDRQALREELDALGIRIMPRGGGRRRRRSPRRRRWRRRRPRAN